MASLRAPPARPTAATADAETAHVPANPGDILLILIDLVLEHQLALTTRARVWQRDPDLLVDMIGDRPVRPRAVVHAAPTPRPGRILLRLALRKRRRLTLASASCLLKLPAQPRVLDQQTLVLHTQPRTAMAAASAAQTLAAMPCAPQTTCNTTLHHKQDSLHTAGTLPPPPTPQTSANSIPRR